MCNVIDQSVNQSNSAAPLLVFPEDQEYTSLYKSVIISFCGILLSYNAAGNPGLDHVFAF